MRVALTGVAGNVGSFVHRWLSDRGHEVLGIDVRRSDEAQENVHIADLTSFPETLDALRGADRVIHLAGIPAPIVAPEWRVHNTNVAASYNVLLASAELGISRVVQSSSVNAIGLAWSRKPEFDSFPIDLDHRSRNEDGYSLSKLIQEIQAESVARRFDGFTAVSLRLHAVVTGAEQARQYQAMLGDEWAVNGLFGYCTFESVASAFELALTAPITQAEVLWVVEPETFSDRPTEELARQYFPDVPLARPLPGLTGFFDVSRTRDLLDWIPSTEWPQVDGDLLGGGSRA